MTSYTVINKSQNSNYKYFILILGGLTNAVVVAIPSMGLSVLLPEISCELKLSLVQAGLIWGMGALPIIVSSLLAGSLCDRFGPKRVLIVSCLLVGLTGALRGFSNSFSALMILVFVSGFFVPMISISNIKAAGMWFSSKEFGLANGILGLGMAMGFFVGSMITATLVSPWLGGWRNVFFLYGGIAASFIIPWFLTRSATIKMPSDSSPLPSSSFFSSMSHVTKLKNIWLLGFAILGISGSIQGLLGYLPLYLHQLGWSGTNADSVLASFHIASMVCILPITIWSDKLGSRKNILIGAALLSALGVGLISIAKESAILGAVVIAGLMRDSFMALYLASITETRGIGFEYSGIATGFVMIFMGLGNLLAPPIGNSLAEIGPGIPFLFWAILTLFGTVCIALGIEQSYSKVISKENCENAG